MSPLLTASHRISVMASAAVGSSPLEIDIQSYCGLLRHEVLSEKSLMTLALSQNPAATSGSVTQLVSVSRYDYWNYLSLRSGTSYIDISTNRQADFDIEQAAGDLIPHGKEAGPPSSPWRDQHRPDVERRTESPRSCRVHRSIERARRRLSASKPSLRALVAAPRSRWCCG